MKNLALFGALFSALLACSLAQRCEDAEQQHMQTEFTNCINNYTNIHHDAMGKAETDEEYKTITCQILRDTVKCGNVWSRCYKAKEVRSMKDSYIKARMDQMNSDRQDLDVSQCDVVKEYLASGRAQQEEENQGARCSHEEVNALQRNFQNCSYSLTSSVWSEIQELKDLKLMELRRENLNQKVIDESKLLNANRDIKPLICKVIGRIEPQCTKGFSKCYSEEDGKLLKRQHLDQLKDYFSGMYSGLDLSSCPEQVHGLEEDEGNQLIRFGEDELDYPEETNDINGPTTTTTTTTRPTTTMKATTKRTTRAWNSWSTGIPETTTVVYGSNFLDDYNVSLEDDEQAMDMTDDRNDWVVKDIEEEEEDEGDEDDENEAVENGYHAGEQKAGSQNLIGGSVVWISSLALIQIIKIFLWH